MNEALTKLAVEVGAFLHARHWTLATAESCTGGLVAAAITEVAGSSGWFDSACVTYSNEAKIRMLGVASDTLKNHGAVSEATVREMLAGVLTRSGADVAVALSGIAGPSGGTQDKPVGTVWMAWGTSTAQHVHHAVFPGNRAAVREAAARFVLEAILRLK
ncbi:CinA family protein [Viridibacterium curvum]|uniref:CinA family protein n=1 Tax=Viridibacterium curvum TaxID=1101404 RepID=A0ABP9QQR8_9RHOO